MILCREPRQAKNEGISSKRAAMDRILLTRLGQFDLDAQFYLGENLVKTGITGGVLQFCGGGPQPGNRRRIERSRKKADLEIVEDIERPAPTCDGSLAALN